MVSWLKLSQEFVAKLSRILSYPTVTVEYPYVTKPIVKLSRIQIENNFSECTACKKCEVECPTKAISIEAEEYSEKMRRPLNSKDQPFLGVISKFQIDYSKCVYCSICINACPAESLSYDRNFTKPSYQLHLLKSDLVHIPRSMRPEEKK